MKKEPTLICIPDISGFTQFMSEVDIDLSSQVIPSLLNKIIYSNEIGLKVSEIEGDAVLFFRHGSLPSLKTLLKQCKLFYKDFYLQMEELIAEKSHKSDSKHILTMLGLKIVLHFGEDVGAVQVGTNIKLMGEDVIVAHRLLKNSIDSDEYVLISQSLLNQYDNDQINDPEIDLEDLKWGTDHYDHIGDVKYRYLKLKPSIKE